MKKLITIILMFICLNINASKYVEVYNLIISNNIPYPTIVMSQAILETGHFKSNNCVKNNNLFGLYDSKTKSYYKFNSFNHSIIAYKKYVLNKYKQGEDFYSFLTRIGYAEDPDYIKKVKGIEKRLIKGEFGNL